MRQGQATGLRVGVVDARRARPAGPPAAISVPAALIGVGIALPLVYLVMRALGAGPEVWDLLLRSRNVEILVRSVVLAAAVTCASAVIAVPLAWLTVRTDLPFRGVWSVVTALPLVIPSYVGAFLVILVLGPKGMLQGWLAPLGVERLPEIFGLPGATLTLTLLSYPYVLLPVRAALVRLDPTLEETSRTLGKSAWQTFFRVTLPLLRPSIAAGSLLAALYTLSDFGAVSLMQYKTFTWAIYIQYGYFARDLAAALSLVLAALALAILVMEGRVRGKSGSYRSGRGGERPAYIVRLGRWRWPALAFCGVVALLSLVMPMSVLVYWVIRGVSAGESLLPLWGHAWNSLYVSGLAAMATTLAALPIAILSVRYPGRLSGLLERFAYLGFALPGVVVALALVFFGIRFATPLYQTTVLLVFAYLSLFLSPAVGAVRTSLLQVSPALEEAARNLGRTHFRALLEITFPLARPGVLAGASLVFLLTMKELPATLILSPIGFKTLATSIWGAAEEGYFAQAAVGGLLLIAVSSAPMAFLVMRRERSGD